MITTRLLYTCPLLLVLIAACSSRGGAPETPLDLAADPGGEDMAQGGEQQDLSATARADLGADMAPVEVACKADTECGGGGALCLVGRCYDLADEEIAVARLPSPDSWLLAGVDWAGPLRVFGQASSTVYQAVKDRGVWTGGMYGTATSSYNSRMRVVREPGGKILAAYLNGTTVIVGGPGTVVQSRVVTFDADYSPKGELFILTMHEETGFPGNKYPVRIWSLKAGTWQSDLVIASVFSDTAIELRFRVDGTPEVLTMSASSLGLYRKELDAWKFSAVYSGPGTHFGALRVLNTEDGTSHVFAGTRTFMREPSTGELILDYLKILSDGSVARKERSPVGGYAYVTIDAALDQRGSAYALVNGEVVSDRYPSYVVRVSPTGISASALANYERTIRASALGVGGDGALYLVASAGSGKPVRLRTFTPR